MNTENFSLFGDAGIFNENIAPAEIAIPKNTPVIPISPAIVIQERNTRQAGKQLIEENMPDGCKAIILAKLEQDDSDPMTDYFGSTTIRTVVLAFSMHEKNSFAEMKKAAGTFPETKFLETGIFKVRVLIGEDFYTNGSYYYKGEPSHWHNKLKPANDFTSLQDAKDYIDKAQKPNNVSFDGNSVSFYYDIQTNTFEHKENYTGGGGYYLAENRRSGWKIKKWPIRLGYMEHIYDAAGLAGGFIAFKDKSQAVAAIENEAKEIKPAYANITVVEDYSEKSFALTGIGTADVKDILAALNGTWNRNLKCGKGWIFSKKQRQAVKDKLGI